MAYGFHKTADYNGRILLIPAVCALLWMMIQIHEGRFFYVIGKCSDYIKSPPGRIHTSRQGNMAAEAAALRRESPAMQNLCSWLLRPGMLGTVLGAALLLLAGGFRMAVELRPFPIETALEAGAGSAGEEGAGERSRTGSASGGSAGAGSAAVEGSLKSAVYQNGGYTLILKDPVILMDGRRYALPAMMVTAGEVASSLTEGMRLRVTGTPELFAGPRNPGEFDYRLYYRSRKLRCKMKAGTVTVLDRRCPPLRIFLKAFRSRVSEALSALCTEEDRGIYEALILGDKTGLDEDIRTLYQRNGIAHLLAVSGLHVGLLGMGLHRLLRRLGLRHGTAGLLSAGLIFFYGCVTGFGPSVFRAVLMMAVSFLASRLGRTYDLLSAASLALFLLAADEPFLLFTSGVQLSFGAVFAIGIGAERLREWDCGKSVMWPGLFIQIFTFPVILYHFFEFPIYGIFLNLLVIPLIGYVVGTGILAVALYTAAGFLTAHGLSAAGLSAAGLCRMAAAGAVGPGHYILAFYDRLCRGVSRLPYYSVTVGRPLLFKIFLYYAAVLLCLSVRRGGVKWRKVRFLLVTGISAVLLAAHPVRGLETVFLDVGQGDGIFLRAGKLNILVDGGSTQVRNLGKSRLIPFLKSKGVSRLDYVFVSHGDQDHISGIFYLLEEGDIAVSQLVFSCLSEEDESCRRLAALAKVRGSGVRYMKRGDSLMSGKLRLTAVYPEARDEADSKNGQSLVLLAEYGDFSMLLTGDVEEDGEMKMLGDEAGTDLSGLGRSLLPQRLTVLKAAHHGSKTSTGKDFLERVNPAVTVLSYGSRNSYGHPSKEVVKRLEVAGTEIWRTAVSGAVTVKTDGRRLRVEGFTGNAK